MIRSFYFIPLLYSSILSAQSLDEYINQILPSIVSIYQDIHAHPELSYYEERTSTILAHELRNIGFEVAERVGTYSSVTSPCYGVVGVMRNGKGPTLLIRADMDALPVEEKTDVPYASTVRQIGEGGHEFPVMHACGHDIHVASLIGVGRLLAQLRPQWKGTVILIGQPAEERGAGARALLADSLYERFGSPDYALALHTDAEHPAGTVGINEGPTTASVDMIDVTMYGIGGHGAYPHKTIDPVVMAAEFVMMLQTIVSREVPPRHPAVVSVGSICGGTKHNIIPDEVHLQLTVRTYDGAVRDRIIDAIKRKANAIAQSAGVSQDRMPRVIVRPNEYTPPQHNDTSLTRRLRQLFLRSFGEKNIYYAEPTMGGEDFAYYRLNGKLPSCFFRVGAVNPSRFEKAMRTGERLPSLHSSEFLPDAEPTLRTAIKAMTSAALELLR